MAAARRRAETCLAAGLLALGVLGCDSGTPATINDVTMLRYTAFSGQADARANGTIDFRDGCIWLDAADGPLVVLWPPDATFEVFQGRAIVYVGGHTGVGVGDGSEVGLGGRESRDQLEVRLLAGTVPAACSADRYWLATDVGVLID
jgi:hypothetical protein